MTDEQVYELIAKTWETRDRSLENEAAWGMVAKKLKDKGHVSPRTGRSLSGNAVRAIYYNFHKKPPLPKSELRAKILTMKSILQLKGDADTKLKLLQQMIDGLED
jgi:hypothetical protein